MSQLYVRRNRWIPLPELAWDKRARRWRSSGRGQESNESAAAVIGFPRRRPRAMQVLGGWEPPHRVAIPKG